ncbi:MAG: hypothetical protein KC917_12285, partial [Candidatus Omnitrophica bacterium]|nr:hypothetical protein [Candidatus Omnitrophota bacterium]
MRPIDISAESRQSTPSQPEVSRAPPISETCASIRSIWTPHQFTGTLEAIENTPYRLFFFIPGGINVEKIEENDHEIETLT